MPQLGNRFLVRVHSGFAQDAAVEVALSADGLITKLEMKTASALGGNAAAAGSSLAEAASK